MLRLSIFILLTIFLSPDLLNAQNRLQPVTMGSERNRDGDQVLFYARNRTNVPYTVKLAFSNVSNAIPPRNPYFAVANPGRSTVLRLRKAGAGAGNIGYSYMYSTYKGCYDTEPDTDIEYLLPISDGNSAKVMRLIRMDDYLQESGDEAKQLGHSFRVNRGDTIFAARKGKISEVVENNEDATKNKFNRNSNWVEVVHEDCTFARYRQLQKGSIMVSEGDDIYPGDPIAIVADAENDGEEYFTVNIFYSILRDLIKQNIDPASVSFYDYYIPAYRTRSGKKRVLEQGETATAVHAEEVITQEMSRRERRRYRRRN